MKNTITKQIAKVDDAVASLRLQLNTLQAQDRASRKHLDCDSKLGLITHVVSINFVDLVLSKLDMLDSSLRDYQTRLGRALRNHNTPA